MKSYSKPLTEIVIVNADEVMQGIQEVSASTGGTVKPSEPAVPGGELSNQNNLWDQWEDDSNL